MEVGLNRAHLLLFLFLLIHFVPGSMKSFRGEELEHGGGSHHEPERAPSRKGLFMLHNPKQLMKTEGGKFTVFRGVRRRETNSALHIGFLSMEPNTLLVPQYMDASLILFIRRGEAKVGWIHKNELVERTLKSGDVYRIPAGSAFYMVNKANGQRLQIICSIDTSESLGGDLFESFFIAGGSYPTSVLAGFDVKTLTTAFNVSVEELRPIMERQKSGPIVYMTKEDIPSRWSNLMKLQHKLRRNQLALDEEDDDLGNKGGMEPNERTHEWSWRSLLDSLLGKGEEETAAAAAAAAANSVRSPDSYNLFDRSPDFQNRYGWSLAIDSHHYSPLKDSGIGIYYVNLSAGSMMAPHVNPTATEYGVVLRGRGTVQVVFPNGTSGMNTEVAEGDVFWVPRYFPFCQIASRSGPLEFFGFTTSARSNRPQFLAGKSSLLRTLGGPEMAAAFGVAEQRYRKITMAQQESIIIPSWPETAAGLGGGGDGRLHKKAAVVEEEEGIVEAV